MLPWTLVSPASRGIGFSLARRVLQTTKAPVVATARRDLSKTKEDLLDGLNVDEERLTVLKLDVLDESTIADAAMACRDKFPPGSHQLQLAFLVPGILFPEKSPSQIDADDALLTFRTNTLGPMLMLKHFSPFLPKKSAPLDGNQSDMEGLPAASTTAIMSARVGSISDNRLGGWYSYRASKSGVNQLVKTFDNHLRTASGQNAIAVALHPGTVKTDLSKDFWASVAKEKLFDKDWAATRLVDVVKQASVEGRGRCWDWNGKEFMGIGAGASPNIYFPSLSPTLSPIIRASVVTIHSAMLKDSPALDPSQNEAIIAPVATCSLSAVPTLTGAATLSSTPETPCSPSSSAIQSDSTKRSEHKTGELTGYLLILTPLDSATRICKTSLFHRFRKSSRTNPSAKALGKQKVTLTRKSISSNRHPAPQETPSQQQENCRDDGAPIHCERREVISRTADVKRHAGVWEPLLHRFDKRDRKSDSTTSNDSDVDDTPTWKKAVDAATGSPQNQPRDRQNRRPGYYASRRPLYTRNLTPIRRPRLEFRNSWAGPSDASASEGRLVPEKKRWSDPAQYPFSSAIARELAEQVQRYSTPPSQPRATYVPCIAGNTPSREVLQEVIDVGMRHSAKRETGDHV